MFDTDVDSARCAQLKLLATCQKNVIDREYIIGKYLNDCTHHKQVVFTRKNKYSSKELVLHNKQNLLFLSLMYDLTGQKNDGTCTQMETD